MSLGYGREQVLKWTKLRESAQLAAVVAKAANVYGSIRASNTGECEMLLFQFKKNAHSRENHLSSTRVTSQLAMAMFWNWFNFINQLFGILDAYY